MRRAGLIGALLLLAAANALVLGGVAWNRSATPDASLRLTERELPLYNGFYRSQEDSSLALQLTLADGSHAPDWLDAARLRELGFESPWREAGPPHRREGFRQPLPRRAWLVLEFDGPAWQAALAVREQELAALNAKIAAGEATLQQRQYREQQLQQMRQSGSRLVAIDVGRDAQALRLRYPDPARYLITAAEVRVWFDWREGRQAESAPPTLHGRFAQLLPGRIHLALPQRAALQAALGGTLAQARSSDRNSDQPPRYAVLLNYGVRHEPWVAAIEPLSEAR